MLVSYKWLQQEYFDNKLPSPEEVSDALLLHSFEIEGVEEREGDFIIDADVLPNRAHDCLSHRGIAKELSLILGIPFSEKTIEAGFSNVDPSLTVDVQEPELCPRFVGRILKNVKIGESPDWLKERLEVLGQRSINALVDVTNYVTQDIGQPVHVFDADKVKDAKLIIKKSDGETITLLGGQEVELSKEDLVIASEEGSLDIAGIKGGTFAEVDQNTKNIILTSAHFDAAAVRKTSRRTKVLTDASKRFENTPDLELTAEAMEYLTRLVMKLCSTDETVVEYPVDVHTLLPVETKVTVELEHINKILGLQLALEEVADIFNRFGWDYTKAGDEFTVMVPSERPDIQHPTDLVEEVGRIYGYVNIPSLELSETKSPVVNKEFYYVTKIKQALVRAGFSEVYTQSFVPEGKLKMANPVAQDRPYLRSKIDLSDAFLMNTRNKDLLGLKEVRMFEIGTIFNEDATEHVVLSLRTEKKLTENLLEEFGIKLKDESVEVDLTAVIKKLPEVASYDDLDFDEEGPVQYESFSVYPFVVRDIAVWVPKETERQELAMLLQKKAGDLLVSEPQLTDEYPKDDRVSYAHRLVFQSKEKTLTDEEVGEIMKEVEAAIADKEGWEVR